jgi:hypothetical protein
MHKYAIIVAGALALGTANSSSVWAKWGCFAKSPNGEWSTMWNSPDQKEASAAALRACRRLGGKNCRIVDCDSNVETEAQADAKWPPPGSMSGRCGHDGEEKC